MQNIGEFFAYHCKRGRGGTSASVVLFSSGIKKALVLIKMYITYHPDKNGLRKNYVTFCKDLYYVNLKEDRRRGQHRIRKYGKKSQYLTFYPEVGGTADDIRNR